MTRILIVDDHAIVRQGIEYILRSETDRYEIVGAGSAEEALVHFREQGCDLVILDLNLPGLSGLEMLKQIHHSRPELPVLVLSMQPEDQVAIRVLKAGASGYMTKDSAPEELIKAIHKILQGGRYISATLAERLVMNLQDAGTGPTEALLSDREYEVMQLISDGKTVTQIAEKLSLSVKTVSTYRSRLLEKLNLTNTAEIVRYALRGQRIE